jgi:hypothetical protein
MLKQLGGKAGEPLNRIVGKKKAQRKNCRKSAMEWHGDQ